MKTSWLLLLLITTLSAAYEPARPGRVFEFPKDHGSHPEFRTEWWYITGHLDGAGGQRFGFQATFFRQAVKQSDEPLFLAHSALLDAKTGRFLHEERLNRQGWDAHSEVGRLDLRNGNWALRMDGDILHLSSTVQANAALALTLKPMKPLVMFGKDGVSRKGKSETAASHYLTFPRLECSGTVRTAEGEQSVRGQAWMDHEISSSQLDEGQVGWDWAAIQLLDGTEVMVYRMRRTDGTSDPAGTTLAWIDNAGGVRHIDSTGFSWAVDRTWESPRTKARYPIAASIKAEGKTFRLVPVADDQELGGEITGLAYWEGACDVKDAAGTVIGRAFLELAGYAGDLGKSLR